MAEQNTSPATRRFGYVVAIVVNIVMLVIVNNILEWGWLSWLTDEWSDLAPMVSFSIIATIIVNAAYLAYDSAWFKSLTQVGLLVISLFVTIRIYQVFPFDFSAYEGNWEALARGVLIVAMVGIGIGLIVELVKLAKAAAAATATHQPSH